MSLRPKSHNVLYTTPEDEDSFPPQVHVAPLGHHTSSMANVWINNHHSTLPSSASIIQADFTSGTTCSQGPRLPASHLAAAQEDLVTLNSFDMLDDLEIPPRVQDSEVRSSNAPAVPHLSIKTDATHAGCIYNIHRSSFMGAFNVYANIIVIAQS